MQKKSLLFAKSAIISLALLFNLCSNAFGQCLSSFFKTNPDRYEIDVSHTVSSDCTIDHNVIVLSGCTLTFNGTSQNLIDITFALGKYITVENGGSIKGSYTTFKPGQGVSSWGGIRMYGGTPTFIVCNFYSAEKSTTANCGNPDAAGGALWVYDGVIQVTHSGFYNCESSAAGGAIALLDESKAEIFYSSFEGNNNKVGYGGGAIAVLQGSKLTLEGCSLSGNSSVSYSGGAILVQSNENSNFFYQSGASIINSYFSQNAAIASNACGGAIAIIRSTADIGATTFINNTSGKGGAIYCGFGIAQKLRSSDLTISNNSIFSGNTASLEGGAIYCESFPYDYALLAPFHISSLAISSNTEFTGNTAVLKGGAISMLRSKADISETTFSGNLTNDEDGGGYGGAFYSSKNRGEIKFVECTFEENSSDIGGAIAIQSSIWDYPHENRPNNILIEESDFRLNSTTSNSDAMGGAVYIGDYPSTSSYPEIQTLDGLLIQGNEFDHNNSPHGGAFCLNNMDGQGSIASYFLISRNFFLNNIASSTGGAMVLKDMNYGEIDFFLNKVTGNSSASHGGGIYMSNVEDFNCINNLIADNTTDNGNGGGIYVSNSDNLAFGSNSIANNGSNGYNGGGIYFSTSNTNSPFPVIFNSIIWGNSPNSLYDATYSNYWDYCQDSDIEGIGGQGQNNIDVDTEFTDPSNGDYTLDCEASPCVNAGNNFFFHTDYDLLLNDRIDNNPHVIDMGAYECPTQDAKRMKNKKSSREISIFPNPFNGELSVQSPEPIVQIRLYSITGQLMLIERPVKTTHSIVCPECPAGVYILHITTSSENHVKRVIKTDKQ